MLARLNLALLQECKSRTSSYPYGTVSRSFIGGPSHRKPIWTALEDAQHIQRQPYDALLRKSDRSPRSFPFLFAMIAAYVDRGVRAQTVSLSWYLGLLCFDSEEGPYGLSL